MTKQPLCLITGATGNIGTACANILASRGVALVLSGRQQDKLAALEKLLADKTSIRCITCDLTKTEQTKALFQSIQKEFGRLDYLINAAGIMQDAPLAMTSSASLENHFSVNVFASYYCCQYASRLMARHGKGSIVNFSSVVGEQGSSGQSAYAASKSAISGLTRALAKELAVNNIRVNAVAPGFIKSDLTAHYDAQQQQHIREKTLLKRLGTVSEVGELVAFLSSEQSAYITGQVIAIDGGLQL